MPGMNGFQFVEASARRWPGLRYIFITGAAEERVLEDATRLPGPLVMKPFIPYRISDAIAAVLANPAAHDVETEPPPPPLPAA
jgi:CheY-like chemotaxis protein